MFKPFDEWRAWLCGFFILTMSVSYWLALLDLFRSNWFHISQPVTIGAIGHQKLDAKPYSGANLVMYDVY
jgi:hypothetical protein